LWNREILVSRFLTKKLEKVSKTSEPKTGLSLKPLPSKSFHPIDPNRGNSPLRAESLPYLHFKLSWHYFTSILAMAGSRHNKALRSILQVFGRILSPTNPPIRGNMQFWQVEGAETGIRS
jgi:hypothetical protein